MLAIYAGNAFLTLIYFSLAIVCFGFFSLGQLKKLLFPLIDLLALIHFPFVERLENLLFGFFLFLILITVVMYLWAGLEAVTRITPKAKSPLFIFITVLVTFCIAIIPKTIDQVNAWITNLGYVVTGIGFGLPIILIIVLLIQGKGRESHA